MKDLRTLALLLPLLILYAPLRSAPEDHTVLKGDEADERISGAAVVRYSYDRSVPSFVRFRTGEGIVASNFTGWLKKMFRPLSGMELVEVKRKKDRHGWRHVRYQQRVNGVPVKGGTYIAHIQNGKVKSMNGILFASLGDMNASPSITKDAARNKALDKVDADLYKWEHPGSKKWLRNFTENPDTSYFPEGKLSIVPSEGNVQQDEQRLAYAFNVYAHEPVSRALLYIDARSGEFLYEDPIIKHADDTGTAVTGYSGNQTIVSDSVGPNTWRLRESGRGGGIETYNMQQGTDYNNAVDFTDDDNFWDNANAQLDEYAGDAHWGAEMTYDYFWQEHNRNSIDDQGFPLLSYIHYDIDYGNAFWDGQRMTYGDGSSGNNPFTALDICAHEVSHGLTSNTADLVYQDESGALNESFSDIFGNAVEYFAKPAGATWEVGEDIGGIRDMSDPQSYGDPNTYQGNNWHTGSGDNGGVHTNSGVQNYWFYLMVEGGSGTNDLGDNYSVTAVDWDTAGAITFRNLVNYLSSGSEYADARFYAIQSAIDLYGACSQPHISTMNAWYAVGLGDAFDPSSLAEFSVDKDSLCEVPGTVEFTPQNDWASSYKWYFGDGDSSSTTAPTHTYGDTGTYDVTLQVSTGCGNDTITKQELIVADDSIHCTKVMPTSSSETTNVCTGTLFDSGGPDGDYPNQDDSYYTIAPTGANQVTLDFQSFDIEPGSGSFCDYDYLEVFDGASASAPSLGVYCNTSGSPGVISSSGGAITLHLHSDQAVNDPGFEVDWYCSKSSGAPKADFYVSDTLNCRTVQFYEQAYMGTPDDFHWEFGDGDTSDAADPSHSYDQEGSYTVKLVVSNSSGSDSVIKTDQVHVQVPQLATSEEDTVCEDDSAELYAEEAGGGHIHWYDAASGGNLLGSSNAFTTASLSSSSDHYAEPRQQAPVQKVGPEDNNFGSGGNYSLDQHLVFDCDTPSTLVSVKVYADGAKNRTIELRNEFGTVLQDTTVFVPDGEQRVQLDFDIPEDQDLQLGVDGSGADLYRNDGGVSYPYAIDELVKIRWSSATSSATAKFEYYYFFYDWEVRGPDCIGDRTKVSAIVEDCSSLEEFGSDPNFFQVRPNPSKGHFVIEGNFGLPELHLEVTDSYGRQVERVEELSGDRTDLDLSDLSPGIYFLRITDGKDQQVERLVVEE